MNKRHADAPDPEPDAAPAIDGIQGANPAPRELGSKKYPGSRGGARPVCSVLTTWAR